MELKRICTILEQNEIDDLVSLVSAAKHETGVPRSEAIQLCVYFAHAMPGAFMDYVRKMNEV